MKPSLFGAAIAIWLGFMTLGAPARLSAAGSVPTAAPAVVDGAPSEWDLTADFFSDMFRAGNPSKPLESKLYLRYDCLTETVYALVLAEPGVPAVMTEATAWIAIDRQSRKFVTEAAGNDGVPSDFAWIDPGYDGDPAHARGYEASFHLWPGTYAIIAHVDVFDAANQQTSASPGFPGTGPTLALTCLPAAAEPTTWSRIKSAYR